METIFYSFGVEDNTRTPQFEALGDGLQVLSDARPNTHASYYYAFHWKLEVISIQLSVVSYQYSVVSYQYSVVSGQFSVISG